MILLIDNFDSFSYNLFQLIGALESDIKVVRNNELEISEIEKLNPKAIIISPGPGKPKDAGLSEDIIKYFAPKIPILGICLGHQAMAEVFGGKITYAPEIMHGKTSVIQINNNSAIFKNLPSELQVARYHSLVADKESLSDEFEIIAQTKDGVVMGIKHKKYDLYGLQFHPESVLTPCGNIIAKNFLEIIND